MSNNKINNIDYSDPKDNVVISNTERPKGGQWIKYAPETFGIRQTLEKTKYRWCVREALLWGIATGTAMSLHRIRMQSSRLFMINAGGVSFFTVYIGSYYYCYKKRDHHEKMIEIMMKLNQAEPASSMPAPIPIDNEHPFMNPIDNDDDTIDDLNINNINNNTRKKNLDKQYTVFIPERKEWQKPLPPQDLKDVLVPVDDSSKRK